MAEHRANPACASCHKIMDPIGFALENFDAVGAWRTEDAGAPIDASGELADGTTVDGVVTLRQALLARPELFVGTMTEKLLTYALGRGLDASRHAGGSRDSSHRPPRRLPVLVPDPRRREQRAVSDAHENGGAVTAMFITKISLPRRTFLRGVGASVALPLLDAMVPALTAHREDGGEAALRFGAVFVPNGAIMEQWIPSAPGIGLRVLADLEAARAVPGSAGRREQPRPGPIPECVEGDHAISAAGWLTGVYPKRTEAEDVRAGTIDRSGRRQADRPGHAVPVARAGDGGLHRLHRRVHERVQLRVHRTRSRGARRRRRCRWRSTRAWCSSGCSVGPGRRSSATRAGSAT